MTSAPRPSSLDAAQAHAAAQSRRQKDRAAIRRFQRVIARASCGIVESLPFGEATLTPDLELAWDASGIEVDRPARSTLLLKTVDDVMEGVGLPFRRIATSDATVAAALSSELPQHGYITMRLRQMALWNADLVGEHHADIRAVDEAAYLPLHSAMVQAQPWGQIPGVDDQLAELQRRCAAASDLVRLSDGIHATALLWQRGGIGEIDSIDVAPVAHRRGLGSALLAAAVAIAEHASQLVFLEADANDWPWRWYERRGFVTVGSRWLFTRPAPS